MACVSCFIWPILLFLWYRFVHPFVLKFWYTKRLCSDKPNVTAENGENENNMNKCYFDRINSEQSPTNFESVKKEE